MGANFIKLLLILLVSGVVLYWAVQYKTTENTGVAPTSRQSVDKGQPFSTMTIDNSDVEGKSYNTSHDENDNNTPHAIAHGSKTDSAEAEARYPAIDDEMLGAVFNAVYTPITDGATGEFKGFQLDNISPDAFAELPFESSLQNGDLVTQINAVRLESEESLEQAIAQLSAEWDVDVIHFSIMRAGAMRTLSFAYQR